MENQGKIINFAKKAGDIRTYVDQITKDPKLMALCMSQYASSYLALKAQLGNGFTYLDWQKCIMMIKLDKDKQKITSLDVDYKTDEKTGFIKEEISGVTIASGIEVVNEKPDALALANYMAGLAIDMTTNVKTGVREGIVKNTDVLSQSSIKIEDMKMDSSALADVAYGVEEAGCKADVIIANFEDNDSFAEAIVNCAPPLASASVNEDLFGFLTLVPSEFSPVTDMGEEEIDKTIEIMLKSKLPSGPYRRRCDSHVYGVRFPITGVRYIEAIMDHPIPENITDVHLYTKDITYAVAFANRYPKKNFFVLSNNSSFNDKARIGTLRRFEMIDFAVKNPDNVMRIGLDYEKPNEPKTRNVEGKTIWTNAIAVDLETILTDIKYKHYSRYMHVMAYDPPVHDDSTGQYVSGTHGYFTMSTKCRDGVVVATTNSKLKTLRKYGEIKTLVANSLIHHLLSPWIITPLCETKGIFEGVFPILNGKITTKTSKELDKVLAGLSNIRVTRQVGDLTSKFAKDKLSDLVSKKEEDIPLVKNRPKKIDTTPNERQTESVSSSSFVQAPSIATVPVVQQRPSFRGAFMKALSDVDK